MFETFKNGILKENPVLVLALGLCPVLAVTTSMVNAVGMGAASTFVLVCSNVLVSLLKGIIPKKIRIPCFIVIIATFVTIVQLVMGAYAPALDKSLGLFIPLIVVNCIILGRAEAFASRNSVKLALADGLGMGLGFTVALLMIAFFRESIGSNKLFGLSLIPGFRPAALLALAPGGFFVIGYIMAFRNNREKKKDK